MATYTFESIAGDGSSIKGTMEGKSQAEVEQAIAERGEIPVKVVAHRENAIGKILARVNLSLTRVKPQELILFTKQLSTMLRAGIPILQVLQVLEKQTENRRLKKISSQMASDVREGSSLYNAFSKHPAIFSELYCSMVRAGEASGTIPEVLERLIYIIEHNHKIRTEIKAALRYPAIVLLALSVAFVVLLTFVVPKFVVIFEKAKIKLPLPTVICISLSNFLVHYWPYLFAVIVALAFFMRWLLKTKQGRFYYDRFVLHVPIFGPVIIKASMSRFASIFSILQSSGVLILDSMKILGGTIGNAAIAREFDKIYTELEEGRGIAQPLQAARYFPPMVVNMVAIGEESGHLDEMLKDISVHYDAEVEYATKKMADAIGPLLTVGLAVMVGFFALAIYLPIWNLTSLVK